MIDKLPATLLDAFLAHEDMEHTKRYLDDGRRHGGLTVGQLEAAWLQAWRGFFLHDSAAACDALYDYAAELRLRDLPLPDHLVSPAERRRAMARAQDAVDADTVIQERLREDLELFRSQLARPKH